MKPRIHLGRALLAGAVGGLVGGAVLAVLFRLSADFLLNPAHQSAKLIQVWTTLEPLPRALVQPAAVAAGFGFLGVLHGLVFALLAPALPGEGWRKGVSFAALLWLFSYVFFEFFTPWNLFHEPLPLVLYELLLWLVGALSEGLLIAFVYRYPEGSTSSV